MNSEIIYNQNSFQNFTSMLIRLSIYLEKRT